MNPEIKKFLQETLRAAGQTGLGDVIEAQMIKDLYTRLEDRLTTVSLSKLSEEKRLELEDMVENGENPDAVQAFLQKNIPNYQQVFGQALAEFRQTYIDAVKN